MAKRNIAVVGAGPSGLIAAEMLARAGAQVTVFDRMANPGRKFLLAGRGGLNLTHSEPLPEFLKRYGPAPERLAGAITAFPPSALTAWCEELGQPTFVGTSGRVFPKSLKASPLLRAWLQRLGGLGVRFELGRQWTGWNDKGELAFRSRESTESIFAADAAVLALGGASWPRLGSDGGWVAVLAARGVAVSPLTAANCGVRIAWTQLFHDKHAGEPLKRIALSVSGQSVRGEAVVTQHGLEGGAVYQLVPAIRTQLAEHGACALTIDLRPDMTAAELTSRLGAPIGKQTLSNHLRKAAGLPPVAISLLREASGKTLPANMGVLAQLIKGVPLKITGLEPINRAISSAGGIAWDELDTGFMIKRLPGLFAAGEMLDWEAPTGGYLLQACFSTGVAAAKGVLAYLE